MPRPRRVSSLSLRPVIASRKIEVIGLDKIASRREPHNFFITTLQRGFLYRRFECLRCYNVDVLIARFTSTGEVGSECLV